MLKSKRHNIPKMIAASALIIALMTSCGASGSAAKSSDEYAVEYSKEYSYDSKLYDESDDFVEESVSGNEDRFGKYSIRNYGRRNKTLCCILKRRHELLRDVV